jgi:hypothetical protein
MSMPVGEEGEGGGGLLEAAWVHGKPSPQETYSELARNFVPKEPREFLSSATQSSQVSATSHVGVAALALQLDLVQLSSPLK